MIVLDGLRGESSISELCRREGIAESLWVIRDWVTFYNSERPHTALEKQTPDGRILRRNTNEPNGMKSKLDAP